MGGVNSSKPDSNFYSWLWLECIITAFENSVTKVYIREKLKGKMSTCMHKMEQLRVSYILADYTRQRLRKIEERPGWVLQVDFID